MNTYVAYKTDEGVDVVIETQKPASGSPFIPASKSSAGLVKAAQSFEEAFAVIGPIAATIIGRVKAMTTPADTVEATFGLKLGGKTGAIVAEIAAEGNFAIKLVWNRSGS